MRNDEIRLEMLASKTHRRFNPLIGDWVLVSPHRADRPWSGQVENTASEHTPAYEPSCFLCPGNVRANGRHNPVYASTLEFDNDFPALLAEGQPFAIDEGGLLRAVGERGICRVVCFSPRHNVSLADLPIAEIEGVIDVWASQTAELGKVDFVRHVQVFENRGAAMGASNPHPHCQIWATEHVPNELAKELSALAAYQASHRSCLLCDYVALERKIGQRVVLDNDHFTAVVPFWAVWPFEVLLVSRRHVGVLPDLGRGERGALAAIVRGLTKCYDSLFRTHFPYSMGFHQSPTDKAEHREMHLHAHYYPPLLRGAAIRKFMVGYEMLAEPQRDLTAEVAAGRLRALLE